MAQIKLMHAKLHHLRVTEAKLEYVGSITIDRTLIEQVGILPLEEVHIWNLENGNRLSTYVLPGEANSGVVCLNGAAAHLCHPGDRLIVAAYETKERSEVLEKGHCAKVIIADEQNHCDKFFEQHLESNGEMGINLAITDIESIEPTTSLPSLSAV
ncbi:aspartate 1-decarboxylase [[Limnothrix rosea] IAM M-220]|uniref:aspartate 1-decarboxylase n=1 Tax=[Limnothrix rosea] IAM M-220 TaxID=454133 RepID=UPI00095D8A2B|nr:aspartate 1-decarboxylase [[Limnothrix rosea] IAM M-220]OKH17764.1 aspartate 1-decarboxylase [[Limnothrix rosea] IAM M-220]